MKRIILCSLILIGACSAAEAPGAVEIENFKSGLVCPYHPEKDGGWICVETETVYITGQGTCVFGEVKKRCNWYGFEFDYSNITEDIEVSCISKHSKIGTFGNPDRITSDDVKVSDYKITLKPNDNHFFNPQFSTFNFSSDTKNVTHTETNCSVEGEEVFSFKFDLVYPYFPK